MAKLTMATKLEIKEAIDSYFSRNRDNYNFEKHLESIPDDHLKDPICHYLNALNLRSIGQFDLAIKWIDIGINTLGLNNMFIDIGILLRLLKNDNKGALDFWLQSEQDFNPEEDLSKNTIGNVIVSYCLLKKEKEALSKLQKYFTLKLKGEEGKKGRLKFNISCLYALNKKSEMAIQYGLAAFYDGYSKEDFEREDFQKIIDEEIFKAFLQYLETPRSAFHCFQTRNNDFSYILIRHGMWVFHQEYKNGQYSILSYDELELNECFFRFYEILSKYNDKDEISYPWKDEWILELDELYKRLTEFSKSEISEIKLEWDYLSDVLDSKTPPILKSFWATTNHGFEDNFADLPYMPNQKIAEQIFLESKNLESYKTLNISKNLRIEFSEHDTGIEIEFSI